MARNNPTEEQLHAIANIEQDMPVTAGAGSGKTFVLTHRYLQILAEKKANLNEILTITFTEKAANQMKKKIRDLVTLFARDEHAGEFPPVIKENMEFPERAYWQELLDSFERTYISTIHGFCSRILREQAVRIGLDPEFRVMDDHTMTLQRPEIIRNTIFRLIHQEEPAIAHWLERFSLFQIIQTMNRLIAGRTEYKGLLTIYSVQDVEPEILERNLFLQSRKLYLEKVEPILDRLSVHAEWQHIQATLQGMIPKDTTDNFYPHYEQMKPAADLLDTSDDPIEQMSAWLVILENLKSKGAKGNWDGVDLTKFKKEMKAFRDDVLAPALSGITLFDEQVEKEAIALAISGTRLFEQVLKSYQTWKSRRGYVDYDDLLIKAVELLQEHEDVRKEYAQQFRHILLDEFQDTNPIQFDLVNLLHGGSEDGSGAPNHLFVVGDPKQSIYRFRGTEVSLFNQAKEDLAVPDAALSMSFRSQPGLLRWVDALFEIVMSLKREEDNLRDYEQHYAALTPSRKDIQKSPNISLNLVESQSKNEEDDAGNRSQLEAAYVAKWLMEDLHNIRVEDEGRYRSARYGDVAVLFRRTTHLKQFEYALNLADIPSYTVGGSGFFEKQEILDVLNILQVLTHPEDQITSAGVLRSALFGVSDEGLFRLSIQNRSFRELLFKKEITVSKEMTPEDLRALEAARVQMQQWRDLKDRVNPGRLVDAICTETGYLGIVSTGKEGLQKVRNVEQFIQLAYNFGRNTSSSLAAFVQYIQSLREMSDQEEATLFEDEHDAVQLMTIHKSKGLEFPVVIIPQLDARPASYQPQKDFYEEYGWALRWNDLDSSADEQSIKPFLYTHISDLEREKELAESKRLFYVANTRARDHLLLSGFIQKKGGLDAYMNSLAVSKDNWLDWTLYVLGQNGWNNQSGNLKLDNGAQVAVNIHRQPEDMPLPSAAEILSGVDRRKEVEALAEEVLSTDEIARRWKPEPVPGRIEELNPTSLKDLMEPELVKRIRQTQKVRYSEKANVDGEPGLVTGTEFGSLAHKLFENFLRGSKRSEDKLVTSVVKNLVTEPGESIKEELSAILNKFKETGLYQSLADSEYYTEMPFMASLGSIPLSGQIDLLIKSSDDNYTVVDFKSDDIADHEITATAAHYRPQILGYVHAVAQATGKLPSKALLYFMRLGRSEEITFSQQDLDALEERVNKMLLTDSTLE